MTTGKIEQDIVIKVTGQKDLAEAEKTIEEIDGKKATATVEVDSAGVSEGVAEVSQQLDKVSGTKAEATIDVRLGEALAALDEVAAEAKKSALAVDALSTALGPELTSRIDVERAVSDFQRMRLSLDEITANAGQLGGKLREIDQADPGANLADNVTRASDSTDRLGRSANTSRQALTSMVGNSLQDLGQLGGVAGSAGIALGQMGDQMAAAALGAEALGPALAEIAVAAAPIALLAAGVALVTQAFQQQQEAQKQQAANIAAVNAKLTEQLGIVAQVKTGLEDTAATGDFFAKFSADIADTNGKLVENVGAVNTLTQANGKFNQSLGEIVATLDSAGSARLDFFTNFIEQMTGLDQATSQAISQAVLLGDTWKDVYGNILKSGNANAIEFVKTHKELITAFETLDKLHWDVDTPKNAKAFLDQLRLIPEGVNAVATAAAHLQAQGILKPSDIQLAEEASKVFAGLGTDLAKGAADWAKANKPIEDMPKQWAKAEQSALKLASGIALNGEETKNVSVLMDAYGLTEQQVLDKGIQMWDEHHKAQQAATDAAIKGLQDWAAQMEVSQIAIGDFGQAMADMAGFFPTAARAQEALSQAFALKNAPLDALEEVRKFDDGLRDLAKFINDPKGLKGRIPDIFDPNDVNASAFLQKFASIRQGAQDELMQVFGEAGGGAAGAAAGLAAANGFVDQIFGVLGGKLSKEQITKLLGWDDLTATFKIAIDQQSLAEAQSILDAFVAIPGVDPLLAFQLRVGLAAGTLKPADVLTVINDQLKNMGAAELPSKLMPPDGKSMSDSRKAADDFYKLPGNNAFIPTKTGAPSNVKETLVDTQTTLDQTWVVIPTKLGTPTNAPGTTTPGTTTGRGPRRMVLTRSAAPAGAVAASAAVAPAAVVQPMLVSPTINFNGVGAIGNRYDVMRVVQKANHDLVRLLGNR